MFDENDDSNDEPKTIDDDYYAFLNVAKQASPDEITRAYKSMSKRLHPDKHLDPDHKKEADIMFNKAKKAYDVLIDPHLRAIYDTVGTKGLETDGWVLMEKRKSPQEIREEYERLLREKEERLLQQRTNPKGNISVQINATDLFDHYNEWQAIYYPTIEVSSMSISQSIDAPLTINDTLTLSGSLSSHNGTGQGTVATALRHVVSAKTWCEVELAAGQGPIIALKGFRNFTKKMHSNCHLLLHFSPVGVRPGLQWVVSRHLDKHLIGYLTLKTGMQSSINTMVAWDHQKARILCSIQLGFPHCFVTGSYSHKLEQNDTKLKVAVKAGTFGAVFEYGCETRLSKHSIIGASISIGVPSGVSLRLRLSRANQSYNFPILLSDDVLPNAIFYGTVAPLLSFYCLQTFIINPYNRRESAKEKERVRKQNRSKIVERRKEAEAVITLMRELYARIMDRETEKKGLIIDRALYGSESAIDRFKDNEETLSLDEEAFDVVLPLQCLVNNDSTLTLTDASKAQLPGFYDPCMGEDKKLYIRYKYNERIHQILIDDSQALHIPAKVHLID
ncbi:dnaJ homolog subfamily C member 11-like [Oppia nitens]|uniref:dnaJ homolog subfamily C member 11-like n=1 Tax=Oppia nitens TaxID=1686743 RepID=UPI0023DB5E4D|nr:dnaJ homolog subfamily C member 11-like [Oppia nitens]